MLDIEEALEKIEELESRVEKLTADKKDISSNFEAYRKSTENKEKEYSEKYSALENEFNSYKEQISKSNAERIANFKRKYIEDLAKGDKVLQKKLEDEYSSFAIDDSNEEGVKQRIDKAYIIHSPKNVPEEKIDLNTSGGITAPENGKANGEMSANAEALYQKFSSLMK